jgi:hypothetical protein
VCYFVTAVLPGHAQLSRLEAIAPRHHRQFRLLSNASVEAQLRFGERYYLTTLAGCDCGTPLGALDRDRSQVRVNHDARTATLRARGWSETRVARWIEQKAADAERKTRVQRLASTPSTDQWLAFLTEVLHSGATPYVGILLHWHSGPLSQRLLLHGRETLRLPELTSDGLAHLKEDTLYEFQSA